MRLVGSPAAGSTRNCYSIGPPNGAGSTELTGLKTLIARGVQATEGERQRGPQLVHHALDARGAFAQHRPGFRPRRCGYRSG